MQAVPAAGRPARHDADHDLGHEADQPLHLEDVQAPGPAGSIDSARLRAGVLVAVRAADALVAAGAERPPAVLRRRSVAGEQHAADVGRHAGVVEGGVQLVDGVRPEGVAHLRAVEGDAHGALVDGAVVRDVGERRTRRRLATRSGRTGRTRRWRMTLLMASCAPDRVCAVRRGSRAPAMREHARSSASTGLPEIEPRRRPRRARSPAPSTLVDGDVVVVTSKVVSKAEGARRRARRRRAVGVRRRVGDAVGQGPARRRGRAARGARGSCAWSGRC